MYSSVQSAVRRLVQELQSDSGYRISWVANIAMAFKDHFPKGETYLSDHLLHETANSAAEAFIELLCTSTAAEAAELDAATLPTADYELRRARDEVAYLRTALHALGEARDSLDAIIKGDNNPPQSLTVAYETIAKEIGEHITRLLQAADYEKKALAILKGRRP